ncbi:hypothetical protein ATCC90586_004781 [Pythium insidiosum]|nr:hypothetical protein ATCC90586_004781 [Pythium insidiosum]
MAGVSFFRVGDNVELWRVVAFLALLIAFVMALEQLMHRAEHRLHRYPKYHEMLSKVYRELMILGLVGLGVKIGKEASLVDADSANMLAFQAADLIIFLSALALILQALCVFAVLRAKNKQLDREELVSALDLLDLVAHHHASTSREVTLTTAAATMAADAATPQPTATMRVTVSGGSTGAGSDVGAASAQDPADPRARSAIATAFRLSSSRLEQMVQTRVLRHFFLQSHGLPELFPFSKYLRQAQDNQITHMIDIEMSMWVLLILLLWAMDGVIVLVETWNDELERHALVSVFVIFAWSLALLHLVVAVYLSQALQKVLSAAGYHSSQDMLPMMRQIVTEESRNLAGSAMESALDAMHRVQDEQEALDLAKRRKYSHGCLREDSGFQLVAMCCRASKRRLYTKRSSAQRDSADVLTARVDTDTHRSSAPPTAAQLRQRDSAKHSMTAPRAPLTIRFFSRKALHFLIKFLIMQNGFYVAFLCQAVLYEFPELYHHFGVPAVVLIPLPLVLNMFVFQPRICRQFVVVSCIFRVDVTTLSEVVTHFSESVELRSDFVSCLLQSIRTNGQTVAALSEALAAQDPARTGFIELEELRQVLRRFGCQVSFFRFNGIAKLLFRLKGTRVAYAQVERLLALAEQEDAGSEQVGASSNSSIFASSSLGVRVTDRFQSAPAHPLSTSFSHHNVYPRYLYSVMLEEAEVQRRDRQSVLSRMSTDTIAILGGPELSKSGATVSRGLGASQLSLPLDADRRSTAILGASVLAASSNGLRSHFGLPQLSASHENDRSPAEHYQRVTRDWV